MNRIKVLIADDHAVVRIGLSALIGTERDMQIVGQAKDGVDAVSLALATQPDVIIMDLNYFNGLPEDIQAAIAEAAEYAGQVVSEKALAAEADAEQYLIDEGKTVIEIDMDEFAAHFEGYAEAKYPQLADWVNRIIEADA